MIEQYDIDALVTVCVERLPSRALAHVSEEMGISSADLSERGIDNVSIREWLQREDDIHEIIRGDIEEVLRMNIGAVKANAVAIFIDGAFSGSYNPLIEVVTRLLESQYHCKS